MKIKKLIGLLLSVLLLTGVMAFAACADGEVDGGNLNTYVMEAEYIDIANVKGSGISSDQSGYSMIYGSGSDEDKAKGWSSGYYVGYTYTSECTMDFVFTSNAAATATIVLRLGSELGNISLTPDNFEVKLNGTAITYNSMYVENSESMSDMKFADKTVTTSARLVEGENKITLTVLPNTLKNGATGGPIIDCVKIQTTSTLTYTERTDNPGKGDEI